MKVAIVHYWLDTMRGGEKVVEAMLDLFPQADIYTHLVVPERISPKLRQRPISTTFIQRLPFAKRLLPYYLPLMPLALEQLDLTGYDLVISSESGPAKGIVTRPDAIHICYCHSPMRYIWDQYAVYRESMGPVSRLLMPVVAHYLRQWDVQSAARVDHFVANSNAVAQRIRKYYRRDAHVIHPPVAVDDFDPGHSPGDFYLFVGQLFAYKRADLAVAACTQMNRKLIVIGEGEEEKRLRAMAGPNVSFLGRASDQVLRDHYANCRALLFPGLEDFGIVPVEAMASGRPVIAYRAGGALDTVIDGQTGIFFDQPSVDSLIGAIEAYEARSDAFPAETLRAHAETFAPEKFLEKMRDFCDTATDARDVDYSASG